MKDEVLSLALARALLVLRATLGVFWLQWGVEKFVVPQNTVDIWGYFYGLDVPLVMSYGFGVVEIALAACFFLGWFKTIAYGVAIGFHAVSVAASWRQLIDPWGEGDHLFAASVPVLGASIALFLLRSWDRGIGKT